MGHVTTLRQTADDADEGKGTSSTLTLTTLSLQPLAFSVDRLVSDEDCDWIIKSAEPKMKRAIIMTEPGSATA